MPSGCLSAFLGSCVSKTSTAMCRDLFESIWAVRTCNQGQSVILRHPLGLRLLWFDEKNDQLLDTCDQSQRHHNYCSWLIRDRNDFCLCCFSPMENDTCSRNACTVDHGSHQATPSYFNWRPFFHDSNLVWTIESYPLRLSLHSNRKKRKDTALGLGYPLSFIVLLRRSGFPECRGYFELVLPSKSAKFGCPKFQREATGMENEGRQGVATKNMRF